MGRLRPSWTAPPWPSSAPAPRCTTIACLPRRPVSQRCCGRPAKQIRCVIKHVAVKKRSATGVCASVAHGVDVLLISGGCASAAPQARREFCRTAACQARFFGGTCLGRSQTQATRPPGRNPGLWPCKALRPPAANRYRAVGAASHPWRCIHPTPTPSTGRCPAAAACQLLSASRCRRAQGMAVAQGEPSAADTAPCIDPAVSAQVRLLKHKPQRGLHAQRLMRAPVVIKPIQSAITRLACCSVSKRWRCTHWSLSVLITRSTMPFCSGLYGVMNSCCRP
ncbi:Uncharacterised protein [Comamonas aquatica]|nr:Uncharacterised protein [Comamonas aquatica]